MRVTIYFCLNNMGMFDQLSFELIQTIYIIFMYYYKFINVVYDKIAYKKIIFSSMNL
jgi:hypothetical protein